MTFDIEIELREIKDRCRRMETRLTKFLESQGFETKVKRPTWRKGWVDIPSLECSVKDILSVVPEDWPVEDGVIVAHHGRELFDLYKSENS